MCKELIAAVKVLLKEHEDCDDDACAIRKERPALESALRLAAQQVAEADRAGRQELALAEARAFIIDYLCAGDEEGASEPFYSWLKRVAALGPAA